MATAGGTGLLTAHAAVHGIKRKAEGQLPERPAAAARRDSAEQHPATEELLLDVGRDGHLTSEATHALANATNPTRVVLQLDQEVHQKFGLRSQPLDITPAVQAVALSALNEAWTVSVALVWKDDWSHGINATFSQDAAKFLECAGCSYFYAAKATAPHLIPALRVLASRGIQIGVELHIGSSDAWDDYWRSEEDCFVALHKWNQAELSCICELSCDLSRACIGHRLMTLGQEDVELIGKMSSLKKLSITTLPHNRTLQGGLLGHLCPLPPSLKYLRCELQEPSHGSHPLAAVSDYTAYLPRGLEHLCLVISVGSRDLETKVTSAGSTQARQHAWEETAAAMANLHAALLPSTGLELELDATGSKGYRDSSDDWHYKQNTSSQLFTSGAARAYFRPVASRLRALTCYAMRIAPAVIREAQALPFLQKLQFTGSLDVDRCEDPTEAPPEPPASTATHLTHLDISGGLIKPSEACKLLAQLQPHKLQHLLLRVRTFSAKNDQFIDLAVSIRRVMAPGGKLSLEATYERFKLEQPVTHITVHRRLAEYFLAALAPHLEVLKLRNFQLEPASERIVHALPLLKQLELS